MSWNCLLLKLRAFESLGKISYGIVGEEEKSKIFRRSLYIAEDMNSGDIFTKDNLRIVRPGEGLKPKYYDKVLGRKVNCDVKKGHPVSWGLLFNRLVSSYSNAS